MGVPPAPNVSRFISGTELAAFGNNTALCDGIETLLREKVRGEYETHMKELVGVAAARNLVRMLETQIIRLAFAKSLHAGYPGGVAGKYTVEKVDILTRNWMVHIEAQREDLIGMTAKFGYLDEKEEVEVSVRIQTQGSATAAYADLPKVIALEKVTRSLIRCMI